MKHYHFIGIGGTGLSAIARVLLEQGQRVSGSDRVLSPLAAALRELGATVFVGHDAAHVQGADVVIRSSAVPEENVEVQAARAAGIPVLKRADFLGELMSDKVGLAVAGTHGKTTTTGMLAWVLSALGQDPTFILGGVLQNLGVNARAGQGPYFVIEADEYDRMFLGLRPRLAVVTNLEHDHPDCYPQFEDMLTAFEQFVSLLPDDGVLVACADNAGSRDLLQRTREAAPRRSVAYGLAAETVRGLGTDWALASNLEANSLGGLSFDLITSLRPQAGESLRVHLQVPGQHNVSNALAVLALSALLDLPLEDVARALQDFKGTGRRFEVRGTVQGITVVDDYAHHPTEIRATLQAARQRYPQGRIWAVWQPHTYSRTHALEEAFLQAFGDADKVIITEIYAAREPREAYSGADLAARMPHPDVRFMPTHAAASDWLLEALRPGDVLLVLTAGDAIEISQRVYQGLQERTA